MCNYVQGIILDVQNAWKLLRTSNDDYLNSTYVVSDASGRADFFEYSSGPRTFIAFPYAN